MLIITNPSRLLLTSTPVKLVIVPKLLHMRGGSVWLFLWEIEN